MKTEDIGGRLIGVVYMFILWKKAGLSWWMFWCIFFVGMVINLIITLTEKD